MTGALLSSILVTLLAVVVVLYLVSRLPIASHAKQIVRVVVIILGILSLLKALALF